MPKRKYNKKSEYWDKFNKKDLNELIQDSQKSEPQWNPTLAGDAYYTCAIANYERSGKSGSSASSRTGSRMNAAASAKTYKYSNIREGQLPYYYGHLWAVT